MTTSQLKTSWSGEELEVDFTARPVKADYGVSCSPTWIEVEDITVDEVRILGVPVPLSSLPDRLKKDILNLAEDVEWNV